MTIAPDPAEITPPHGSGAYRRGRGVGLWTVIGLCVASLAIGAALAAFAPQWWPGRNAPPTADHPEPAYALTTPAPEPAVTAEAPSTPPLDGDTGLASRVQALETGQDRTIEAAAAALATAMLAEAAGTSRPFETELNAVEQVLPLPPHAAPLRRLAQIGAPTRSALAAEFDDAAAKAAVAARDPGERGGFLDRMSFALSSIVTIRRVGSTVGDQPDAVLARAERQVDEGDIDGALTTLNDLPRPALRAMAAWRVGAERRAQIDRHVSSIRAAALGALAEVSRARA